MGYVTTYKIFNRNTVEKSNRKHTSLKIYQTCCGKKVFLPKS